MTNFQKTLRVPPARTATRSRLTLLLSVLIVGTMAVWAEAHITFCLHKELVCTNGTGDCNCPACGSCSGSCVLQCDSWWTWFFIIWKDKEGHVLYDPILPGNGAFRYDATNPITVSQYAYDAMGAPTRETTAQGSVNQYVNDASGKVLTKVTDSGGLNLVESWVYDGNGNQLTYTDAGGVVTAYQYDGNGHLTSQTLDPAGLAITTTYMVDGSGRVTQMQDPRGAVSQTYYDSGGRVTKTIGPDGHTFEAAYDANLHVTRQTEYDGANTITRITDSLYDQFGNLTQTTEPGSRVTAYAYDVQNRQTMATLPTGEQTITLYNELGQAYASLAYDGSGWITKTTYAYDGEGNVTSQTDANGNLVSGSVYDTYNRVSRTLDALGNYTQYTYDALGRTTRTVNYDAGNNPVAESQVAYDAAGRVTSQRQLATPGGSTSTSDVLAIMLYDSRGRVTQQTTSLNASDTSVATSIYDATGRRITTTASDAPTLTYLYTSAGDLTKQIIDPAGQAISTSMAYDTLGRATRTTNPDSTYSVTIYDGLGRVTKTQQYDSGGTAYAQAEQLYDNNLNTVTKTYQFAAPSTQTDFNAATDPSMGSLYASTGRLTATVDANGNVTSFDYDAQGRQITTTDPASNKSVVIYDNADRVLTQIHLDYDGTNYTTFTNASLYDSRNQITAMVDQGPDGDITATTDNLIVSSWFDARGRVTQSQDPSGRQFASIYDGLGRVTRKVEDSGGGGIGRTTDSAYDCAGRLVTLTGYTSGTSGAENTVYAYNKANVQTHVVYPDDNPGTKRGYVDYLYDTVQRLTRVNHQDNSNTDMVYDLMGRMLTVTKGSEIDSFGYTAWGAMASAKRGVSGTYDATSDDERSYDGLMRLTREAQAVKQSTAQNVDYAYDLNSNVVTLTYPNGTAIQNTVDGLDRATVVKRSGSTLATYNYIGQRLKNQIYATSPGVTLTAGYDGAMGGRLTQLAYSQTGNGSLPSFSYSFDAASQITNKKLNDWSGAPNESYQYDTLHRLTNTTFGQRSGTPYESFVYDNLGNQLTQNENGTTTAGIFDAANEQTQRGATQVYYDLRGNLTKDDSGQQYFYNADNLLTCVENSGSTVIANYTYDAMDRRIERTIPGSPNVITRFYYTPNWQLLEETDNAGTPNVQRYYVWAQGSGAYIDDLLLMNDVVGAGGTANADYFACRHHNYNIVAMLNSSGGVIERYDYNPYGKRYILSPNYSASGTGKSIVENKIGHQGLFHDIESEVILNRARILQPVPDRFIQRDAGSTDQYLDGMNLYAYTGNRPIITLDPSGYKWTIDRNNGKARATVTCDCGDNIDTLSTMINMDPALYNIWLKSEDGKPKPITSATPTTGPRKFSVPNVVFLGIGKMNIFAIAFTGSTPGNIYNILQNKGFDVVYRDWNYIGPWNARDVTSQGSNLYGIVYFGHASVPDDALLKGLVKKGMPGNGVGWLGPGGGDDGSGNAFIEPGFFNDGQFGLLILKACYAKQGGWGSKVSPNGVSWLGSGTQAAGFDWGIIGTAKSAK